MAKKPKKNSSKKLAPPQYNYLSGGTIGFTTVAATERCYEVSNLSSIVRAYAGEGEAPVFRHNRIISCFYSDNRPCYVTTMLVIAEHGATFTASNVTEGEDLKTQLNGCIDKPFSFKVLSRKFLSNISSKPLNGADGKIIISGTVRVNSLPFIKMIEKQMEDPLWISTSPEVFIIQKLYTMGDASNVEDDYINEWAMDIVSRPTSNLKIP
jgi:hypothetical protein